MKKKKKEILVLLVFILTLLAPGRVFAMHIMEGFLPPLWCIVWGVAALPFIIKGFISIKKTIAMDPKLKLLLAMAGAFTFVLSAMKIPSVTGSCSHPTGVGLGAILFGPWAMSLIALIVLIFQALLLAHGGITTLGANTFSMGIVGPFVSYGIYKLCKKAKAPTWLSVFLAAFLGDLLTYVATSFQLAIAFPSEVGGIGVSLLKFMGIFATTQVPLAIIEGILTVLVFNSLVTYNKKEITELGVLEGVR